MKMLYIRFSGTYSSHNCKYVAFHHLPLPPASGNQHCIALSLGFLDPTYNLYHNVFVFLYHTHFT